MAIPGRVAAWMFCFLLWFGTGSIYAEDVNPAQLAELKRNIAKLDRWLNKANTENQAL